MTTFRVAFIGCGRRARQHLVGIKADPRCRVVALADVSREAARAMNEEAELGAAEYGDHVHMLAKEKPDVVVTCLWTPLHLPVFRDCVSAGVRAVLCEKPMAPTWGECLAMSRLAEESGCQLTFSHQRRFAAGNRLVRRWLAEGRFGDIRHMDLYAPQNLLDCGTHTFDQAMSFNGESPATSVLGAIDTTKLIEWFGVKAENMATGLVTFANGVHATFQFGVPGRDMTTGVRVHCSGGIVEVDWDGQIRRAVVYADPGWSCPPTPDDRDEHMTGVVRNALDSLESGVEPELSHRKALRAAEVIFALYESVRRRRVVTLPLESRDHPLLSMLEQGEIVPAT